MFNSKWSRNAAAAYLLKPTLGNVFKLGFSEGLSQWASPMGTSYGARSIPEGSEPHTQYEVLKPIKVEQSLAAPGERAGQVGYGVQYKFSESMDFYINSNYLRKIK